MLPVLAQRITPRSDGQKVPDLQLDTGYDDATDNGER
jgi:hypothetical protein